MRFVPPYARTAARVLWRDVKLMRPYHLYRISLANGLCFQARGYEWQRILEG